jgi:hypothetical protein
MIWAGSVENDPELTKAGSKSAVGRPSAGSIMCYASVGSAGAD